MPSTNIGGEQGVQYDEAHITWQRIVPTKRWKDGVKQRTDEGLNKQCNIMLPNKSLSDREIFMVEALGSAVIDTACTRTVCNT